MRSAAEMIQNGGNRTPVAAKTYGSTKMKLGAGESLDVEVPLPAAVAVAASPAALELQNELRRLSANTSNRELADGDRRARIELAAKELNALNPIAEPARSPLLAGKWRLLYSTVPGPSSGRFGPFVADVFQDLRPDEKIIFNILELGPSWALRGALEAAVEVLDGSTWAITFDKVYNYLAGVKIQEKKFDVGTERRIWEMTYLDRDFRVLYGRKEDMASEEGFIFILEREKD